VVFLPLTAPGAVLARSVYALGMLRLLVAQGVLVLTAKVLIGLALRDSFEHVGVAAAGGLATVIGSAIVLVAALRAARRLGQPMNARDVLPAEPPS
jgi:peptidoglycan biosynthesis protein MviN/MurJ (putative lipid II flippase)